MAEQDYFTKDYYKILGVDKKASYAEIRKALRKLARKYHPDQNPGDKAAEEKYKEITEAYSVLSDEKERAKYDQMRAMAGGGAHFTGGGAPGGGFEDLFGGFGGGQNVRFSTSNSGGGFSDILSGLFGGGNPMSGMGHDPFGGGYGAPYSSQSAPPKPPASAKPAVDKTYSIAYKNAVFGAKLKHTFKDGSEVTFKVPPGTPSGKILAVKSPSGKIERVKIEIKVPDGTKLAENAQKQLKEALSLL